METQAAQSQDTSDVTNTFTPVGPEDFEVTQLADPACCVSAVLQRPFVGRLEYEGEKQLDATVEAAKQVLPEIDSTYKPSGKTSMLGVLAMLVLAPVLLVFLMLVCGGVSIGWAYLCENAKDSRATGIGSIVLDGLMVFLMVLAAQTGVCFGQPLVEKPQPHDPGDFGGTAQFPAGDYFVCSHLGGSHAGADGFDLHFRSDPLGAHYRWLPDRADHIGLGRVW